jgi:pimeloyl-ACP methyl ester carboxylesterase
MLMFLFSAVGVAQPAPTPVVLLHGGYGSERSMACLSSALQGSAYETINLEWRPPGPDHGIEATYQEAVLPALRAEVGERAWFAVGHSAGGLMIRRLLEGAPDTEREDLASRALGAVLIAVPNAGLGTGLARLMCALDPSPWRALSCDLRRGSPWLHRLYQDFGERAHPPYLSIAGRAPWQPRADLPDLDGDGWTGWSDGVVATDSQSLPGVPTWVLTGARATHRDLPCRPELAEWVLEALGAWSVTGELDALRIRRLRGAAGAAP